MPEQTTADLPDQPDGIEDDSRDLPNPTTAAERVDQYIRASGDGLYDVQDRAPLYARDLEALTRAAAQLEHAQLDATSYRELADALQATMTNPDQWDADEAEIAIMLRYVQHLAADLAKTRTFIALDLRAGDTTEDIEEIIETWYANWPATAVTTPHYPLAVKILNHLADQIEGTASVPGSSRRAPEPAGRPTAGELARLFHETYEDLAPLYGYRTREASAKPWAEVPQQNRELMIATCARVLQAIASEPAAPLPVCVEYAYAEGYRQAVARLRDDARYTNWWTSSDAKPDGRIRHHLADYLETVGPDGIDVTTGRWPARAQDVHDALVAAKPGDVFAFDQQPGQRVLIVVAAAGESQASEPAAPAERLAATEPTVDAPLAWLRGLTARHGAPVVVAGPSSTTWAWGDRGVRGVMITWAATFGEVRAYQPGRYAQLWLEHEPTSAEISAVVALAGLYDRPAPKLDQGGIVGPVDLVDRTPRPDAR